MAKDAITPQDLFFIEHNRKYGTVVKDAVYPNTACRYYSSIDKQDNIIIHCTIHTDTAIIGKHGYSC